MRPLLALLCAALTVCAGADEIPQAEVALAEGAAAAPALTSEARAADVLRTCRAMLPLKPVALTGALILRNRKGIVSSEHDYRLVMRRDEGVALLSITLFPRGETNEIASVTIARRAGERPRIAFRRPGADAAVAVDSLLDRVLDTDVTWLDLTLDFLWWPDAAYEADREGESVHGQDCLVILVKPDRPMPGISAVRLWVDKKTGCLMQAEQVGEDGRPVRRMWGTRVKKFEGRWFASVLEVETLGARRRTKIVVDEMTVLGASDAP